ncbi:MAG: hypothetical protein JHC95_04425 [Solirubrobacteraceae bacterium]|nr:hypothetical protein [Solirubrobacteraceae bacterium]
MRRGGCVLVAAWIAAGLTVGSASAAPLVRPADRFADTVGVNTHVMHHDTAYKDLDRTIQALQWLGVRHVRDGISAPAPPRGAWYRADQRRRFAALGKAGIRLNLITGGADVDGDTQRERLRLVRQLPWVTAVEGPNEWDINGGDDWAQTLPALQRSLYADTHDDPVLELRGVRVVGPSFGRLENGAVVGDLSDAMDVANLHAYTGGRQPEEAEAPGLLDLGESVRGARTVGARKPLMMTETGYHSAFGQPGRMPPTPDNVTAAYLTRMLLEHARVGLARTYLYELFDAFKDPLNISAEAHFGLFTLDYQPKPAASAIRSMLRIVRDARRSPTAAKLPVKLSGGDDSLRSLVLAKSRGNYVLALWRAVPLWDPSLRQEIPVPDEVIGVDLPRRFGTVRLRRPTGMDDPLEIWSDTDHIEVPVGGAPVLVQISPRLTVVPRTQPALRPFVPTSLPLDVSE